MKLIKIVSITIKAIYYWFLLFILNIDNDKFQFNTLYSYCYWIIDCSIPAHIIFMQKGLGKKEIVNVYSVYPPSRRG